MKPIEITVKEISGATFTSYEPYKVELDKAVELFKLTEAEQAEIKSGKSVIRTTYNLVGTPTKRILKLADQKI